MSALETEATSNVVEFNHFGRKWSVPTKRHLSHLKFMRDYARVSVGGLDMMIAEAFLSPFVSAQNQQEPDQFDALLEIDPDEPDLSAFTDELTKAMGFGSSGNSAPSSTSS